MDYFSENVTPSDFGDVTTNSLGPVAGMITVGIVIFILLALAFYVHSDVSRFRRLTAVLKLLQRSLYLFALGVVALVPFVTIGGLVFLFTRLEAESQARFGLWLLYIMGAFTLVTGIGWITEKWLARIRHYREQIATEKETAN